MNVRLPLKIEVTRGQMAESVHDVVIVVMDKNGYVVDSWGNRQLLVYPRSSIKLLQAQALVESGAVQKFSLRPEQLSFACASHSGEELHTQLAKEWMEQMGLNESDLICGPHMPFHEGSRLALIRKNQAPTRVHNNCSGKHLGLLTACKAYGFSTQDYGNYDHPIQKVLRQILTNFTTWDHMKTVYGVDGCGIPSYSLPIEQLTKGFVRFLTHHKEGPLIQALLAEPVYYSGHEDFVYRVMEAAKGNLVVKSGAEGVYTAMHLPSGAAVALKVMDGAARAAHVALGALFLNYKWITESQFSSLAEDLQPTVKNWAGEKVGAIRVVRP